MLTARRMINPVTRQCHTAVAMPKTAHGVISPSLLRRDEQTVGLLHRMSPEVAQAVWKRFSYPNNCK
jgi:hypothetical protein